MISYTVQEDEGGVRGYISSHRSYTATIHYEKPVVYLVPHKKYQKKTPNKDSSSKDKNNLSTKLLFDECWKKALGKKKFKSSSN
jgi:hypothetical protein